MKLKQCLQGLNGMVFGAILFLVTSASCSPNQLEITGTATKETQVPLSSRTPEIDTTETASPSETAALIPPTTQVPPIIGSQIELDFHGNIRLDRIFDVVWDREGSTLAVTVTEGDWDGVSVYDRTTLEVLWSAETFTLTDLSLGDNLPASSGDGLEWWDLETGEQLGGVRGNAYIYSEILSDNYRVAAGYWKEGYLSTENPVDEFESTVFWFDLVTRDALLFDVRPRFPGLLNGLKLSLDGHFLAVVLGGTT